MLEERFGNGVFMGSPSGPGVAGRPAEVLSDLERFCGRLPASALLSRDEGNER